MAETEFIRDIVTEIRADVKEVSKQTVENTTILHTIVGNGRPGRLDLAEANIDTLLQWRWKIAGMAAGLVAIMEVVHVLVEYGFGVTLHK